MNPCDRLLLEACELGNEAIKTAFKANALAVGDPKRWPLTQRMLEINHRLKEISRETKHEDRAV
jgi:hypothetical protein